MSEFITPGLLNLSAESGDSPGIGPAFSLDPIAGIQSSHMTMGFFADDSKTDVSPDGIFRIDNSLLQPRALYDALFMANARGAGKLTLGSDTLGFVEIPSVVLTGPNAAGAILIDPSDVGIGPGQIPPDKTMLSASVMQFHPMSYLRKGARTRFVYSQQGPIGLAPINDPDGFLGAQVFVVEEAPEFSEWTFCIDGSCFTACIQHPTGSDIRRPRDIWEQLIVPQIVLSNSNNKPLELFTAFPLTDPPAMRFRGYVTRFEYLSYARLDTLFSATGTPTLITRLYP